MKITADFVKNGAELIQKKINEASGTVTISGNFEIEKTISIPSDFHIILENCHLRMAGNTFCNMFTNESINCDGKKDKNIIIEGRGNVVLDGGEYNGLSERTSGKNGLPHISANNMLLFAQVDGFRITNLHIRNQRWWAMNFLYCRNGYIGGIDFCADATYLDENGRLQYGLSLDNYEAIRVKNADGIDIRRGCKNIIIENITGFTEDDTVAITSLPGKLEKRFSLEEDDDISGIIVRNVMSSSLCSQVRLLCQGGGKLYNVLVDGVSDTSATCPCLARGSHAVKIGDLREYAGVPQSAAEIYNINVRNVFSRAETAVLIVGPIGEHRAESIMGFDGCIKEIEKINV
ncbi:MAG: hypothetical protein E7441_04785 [Ruminococcaceae bacterium]|nr:hypothetical protein [Oscillospiraceae bacterium]